MKIKKILFFGYLLLSIAGVIFSLFEIVSIQLDIRQQEKLEIKYELKDDLQHDQTNDEPDQTNAQIKTDKQFDEISSENPDFIGWVKFDSGLLNFPLVQSSDNEYYLNHNIEQKEDHYGNPFLDAKQALNGPNLTIYGHHIYNYPNIAFSPLKKLMKASNYEENKYFSLVLNNQTRRYAVCSVVEYNGIDTPYFLYNEYSDTVWENYIKYINNHRLYETDEYVNKDSKILCFQTCIKHNDDRRLLVFAKEIF